jgi:hypothetical protein
MLEQIVRRASDLERAARDRSHRHMLERACRAPGCPLVGHYAMPIPRHDAIQPMTLANMRANGVMLSCLFGFNPTTTPSGSCRPGALMSAIPPIADSDADMLERPSGVHPSEWTAVMPFNWPSAGRVAPQT